MEAARDEVHKNSVAFVAIDAEDVATPLRIDGLTRTFRFYFFIVTPEKNDY